jgi:hypothetical protein
MNEAKPVSEPPNAAPASAPSPVPRQASGSSIADILRNVPILPPHLRQPEPTPKVEVLNPALDEGDLKLSLNVVINGRQIRIMDCDFTTTACGGLNAKNRGIVFQCLENLTDQARQAAAIKLNSALPLAEPSHDEMQHGDSGMIDAKAMNGPLPQDGGNHLLNGAPRY